jgi:hypothetical protein
MIAIRNAIPQRMQFAIASFCLIVPCLVTVQAQPGTPLWTNRYDGIGSSSDNAGFLAINSSGMVFVTGSSQSSINSGSEDFVTIAYANNGDSVWTNRYNGPGNGVDFPRGIAVDHNGNVVVTGDSRGGSPDYTTIKYSVNGPALWTNRYNGTLNTTDEPTGLAIDGNNNVIVTGGSFGFHPTFGYSTGLDYATLKYSSAGNGLWTNRHAWGSGVTSDDVATDIALDNNGNIFVTGFTKGVGGTQDYEYGTVKYTASGILSWQRTYNLVAGSDDRAIAIATDANGNVCVTGYVFSGSTDRDFLTIKYSNNGLPLWTNRYNGPANGSDVPNAIGIDQAGNVFVAGYSAGIGTAFDYATIKYSGSGVPLWTNRFGGPEYDLATALAIDAQGNVYVTGFSYSSGSPDYLTIAYSGATGLGLWTNRYNGPDNSSDFGNAIALDKSGNVFVTGASTGVGTGLDYATIKYATLIPAPDPIPLAYEIIGAKIVLTWTNSVFDLETATTVAGPWTNIVGATSPHTNSTSSGPKYFRLRTN